MDTEKDTPEGKSDSGKGGGVRNALSFITVGLQLAITILLFIWGGYQLDLKFNKSPVFVTLGAVVGMALGFYHLIKQLKDIDTRTERDQNRKRNRWL